VSVEEGELGLEEASGLINPIAEASLRIIEVIWFSTRVVAFLLSILPMPLCMAEEGGVALR